MSEGFLDIIRKRTVLFDGGMGSLLIGAGMGEKEVPEQWNILHPEEMIGFHTAYLEAGAEVVQTNTFGASPIKLAASEGGRSLDTSVVNKAAARLVRTAVERFGGPAAGDSRPRFVAGDIGPTGEFFPPMGKLEPGKAFEAFRTQAEALEMGGVDIFLIETMYDLREALEAVRAVRSVSARPVAALMTFDRKPRGFFTIMGDTPAGAAERLGGAGADVVGANCTIQSDAAAGLAAEFRASTDLPFVIQPNAGKPEMDGGSAVYRQTPEEFAADMKGVIEAGASGVGGCCGTTPDFIRELRKVVDSCD